MKEYSVKMVGNTKRLRVVPNARRKKTRNAYEMLKGSRGMQRQMLSGKSRCFDFSCRASRVHSTKFRGMTAARKETTIYPTGGRAPLTALSYGENFVRRNLFRITSGSLTNFGCNQRGSGRHRKYGDKYFLGNG